MEIILLPAGENRISRDYVVTEVTQLAVKRNDERDGKEEVVGRANRQLLGGGGAFASSRYELLFSLIGFQFVNCRANFFCFTAEVSRDYAKQVRKDKFSIINNLSPNRYSFLFYSESLDDPLREIERGLLLDGWEILLLRDVMETSRKQQIFLPWLRKELGFKEVLLCELVNVDDVCWIR